MAPYDVKKELSQVYARKNTGWELIAIPSMRYIGVDGAGDPNTERSYVEAVEALYAVAYTLKFSQAQRPFKVGPLEGLWWAEDPSTFVTREKSAWRWTMLISQPPWMSDSDIEGARHAALTRKKRPGIERVRVLSLAEGQSAQLLHIGAYDDEGPKLAQLHDEFMPAHGLDFNGPHHEVYLSDPRRTAPAKLKTLLRQPVRPAARSGRRGA